MLLRSLAVSLDSLSVAKDPPRMDACSFTGSKAMLLEKLLRILLCCDESLLRCPSLPIYAESPENCAKYDGVLANTPCSLLSFGLFV